MGELRINEASPVVLILSIQSSLCMVLNQEALLCRNLARSRVASISARRAFHHIVTHLSPHTDLPLCLSVAMLMLPEQRKVHPFRALLGVAHDIIDRLGKVLDVAIVQTGHADATVLGEVNMPLAPQLQNLLLAQTGE